MDTSISFHVEIAEAGGDGAADSLRDYVAANYDALHQRLARYLGCPDLAGDSLHDAWLRLGEMRVPPHVDHPAAYVFRVARNLAVDRLRGECRTAAWTTEDEHAEMPDGAPGPAQTAEARSLLTRVQRALNTLSCRHQAVLFDLRIEERTRAQVAAQHQLSTRRIDTLLRESLDHCAAALRLPVSRYAPSRHA